MTYHKRPRYSDVPKLYHFLSFSDFFTKWLFARLPHMKCIRLGSVRSSHLPFKMHYLRSKSPCICADGRIATTFFNKRSKEQVIKKNEDKDDLMLP